jgi:hypothetical protein
MSNYTTLDLAERPPQTANIAAAHPARPLPKPGWTAVARRERGAIRVRIHLQRDLRHDQPRALGQFWSAVTGYAIVDERDDFVKLQAPGNRSVRHLLFVRVADPTPGTSRICIDLAARDPRSEIDRLVSLGAHFIDPTIDDQPTWRERNGSMCVVLQDPEGNEFCIA